jgi:hypothetical protein
MGQCAHKKSTAVDKTSIDAPTEATITAGKNPPSKIKRTNSSLKE